MGQYSLLIRNATVLDGLGNAPVAADVAVAGGKIAAIGKIDGHADQIVDAGGLTLGPGFVDIHTHYDAQLSWEPTCSPSTALGVTTVVIGNCGFGIAPCPPAMREVVAKNLSEVEGMSLSALSAGIDWDFESFADYLAMIRRKGAYPNVAAFVGHSTVRSAVMGKAASERQATSDEIAAMRRLVEESLRAGAIGFASSTSENHNGYGGVPMPSRLSTDDELRTLVGALGETQRGLFQIVVGPRTGVDFLESLARENGRTVVLSALFDSPAFPERAPAMLAQCAAAQARGVPVYAQVACQPLTMEFSLSSAYPFYSLEAWAPLRGADAKTIAAAIADPSFRASFREQLRQPKKGKLFYGDWSLVEVVRAAKPNNAKLEGATIAALAAKAGAEPVDFFFDLALSEDLAASFNAKLLNADEARVAPLLQHPAGVITLSDGGAHLTFLCDAGYGLHLLGHWVRERGLFDLQTAVQKLTSFPADLYGIQNRGRIAVGAHADLLLFDPATVSVSRTRRVNDLPGGQSRLVRDPIGVHGVWVNGARIFDGTDYVTPAAAPGEVLTRFG